MFEPHCIMSWPASDSSASHPTSFKALPIQLVFYMHLKWDNLINNPESASSKVETWVAVACWHLLPSGTTNCRWAIASPLINVLPYQVILGVSVYVWCDELWNHIDGRSVKVLTQVTHLRTPISLSKKMAQWNWALSHVLRKLACEYLTTHR